MQYSLRTLTLCVAIAPPLLAAMISSVFVPWVTVCGKEESARCQVELLTDAATLFKLQLGLPPPDLQALISLPADTAEPGKWNEPYLERTTAPIDPWNNEFEYRIFKRGRENDFCVWSKGPDGIALSKDDIYPESWRTSVPR